MSRSAFVTGAGGFVGQWLVRALVQAGWNVTGGVLTPLPANSVLTIAERQAVRWLDTDVRRREDLARALDVAAPDAIFHLAGISFLPDAMQDPGLACEVNVVAAARLLGEVRVRRRAGTLDPTVLIVGSGEQYGRHDPSAMPLSEGASLDPMGVYAATKVAQEVMALEASRSDGVRVIATRSFNHSGPGQSSQFLLPGLVERARRLRREGGDTLQIGNSETVRDFLHVRDVVAAYLSLVERGVAGEVYNVSSGYGRSVRELAELVLKLSGLHARVLSDAALIRKVDVPVLVGDPTKLRSATGWAPALPCEDIILDLIHASTD